MAKLKNRHWDQIQSWFCPEPGYVLDFSNKTFAQFFEDEFETNIYADVFSENGTSKYNRLRTFIIISPPHLVIELLNLLWSRKQSERDSHLEEAIRSLGEWSTTDPEYVAALQSSAAIEDETIRLMIAEIAGLPSHSSMPHLRQLSEEWTLDSLDREITRAIESLDKDPEAALTAACAMLESVCRSILVKRPPGLPKKMDIKSLYYAVREPLGLSPSKEIGDTEIEADVRAILSGISNTVSGIGALRTHAGTAHGREKGFRRIDPRIARLAVNSASSISIFLVETWEKRFPEDKLLIEPHSTTKSATTG
ncbi:abortive infection family protein [Yoonia sp. 208BN28-4]|uniref:abortive infection family protein n=1 Tax=Yoonia sp. 208BN28-4 TaxID=3126505 RepID=UPI0030B4BDBB